jgi:site-specific DNA-cytosine methylase
MGINVLSLFDGMSCGHIALDKVGAEVDNYYASEIDDYAIKVTKDNYPNTIHLGDITTVDTSSLPKIDLLIGGSPCQGFSFAGKQLNFNDPRSKLFFEFVRIMKECSPRYFLLENVNMKQEYQNIISEHLGVRPIEINSNLVSAQQRRRLYWTNIPVDGPPEDLELKLQSVLEGGVVDRDKAYCIDANYYKGGNLKSYFEKRRRQLVFDDLEDLDSYRKLTPIECERLQNVPDNYTQCVSNTQRYKMLGNGWTVDVIAHIFKGMQEELADVR